MENLSIYLWSMPIDNFIFIDIFVIWVCYLNTFFQSVTCFYFFIFIFHFTSFFNSCSIRVICIFPPLLSPDPLTPHLPTSILSLFGLSMGPSYMFLDHFSPSFPCYPSPLPSGYCQFFISISLVIFLLDGLFC